MTTSVSETSSAGRTAPRFRDASLERVERLALLTERRKAERSNRLIDLQQSRPDLVSAYAPADFAADALRWTI